MSSDDKLSFLSAPKILKTFAPSESELVRFNLFQVELLLNQAADLLTRMWSANEAYEAFRINHTEQKINLARLKAELDIIDNRLMKTQGQIDTPEAVTFKTYEARKVAADFQKKGLDKAITHYEKAKNEPVSDKDNQRNAFSAQATFERASYERVSNQATYTAELHESDAFKDRFDAEKVKLVDLKEASKDVLDFEVRARRLLPLIERDRNDAFVRLKRASEGLKHVYGDAYEAWLNELKLSDLPVNASDLNELVVWNRNAISFLNAFLQNEQGFTLSISLKDSLISTTWEDWRQSDYKRTPFKIEQSILDSYRYVRLRGISAVLIRRQSAVPILIEEKQELYPWRLTIIPPLRQYAQSGHGLESLKFRQISKGCRVTLGRVETQNSLRMPDLVGMMTLYNLSPFVPTGKSDSEDFWHILAKKPKESFSDIEPEDIRLELSLVGIPKEN